MMNVLPRKKRDIQVIIIFLPIVITFVNLNFSIELKSRGYNKQSFLALLVSFTWKGIRAIICIDSNVSILS